MSKICKPFALRKSAMCQFVQEKHEQETTNDLKMLGRINAPTLYERKPGFVTSFPSEKYASYSISNHITTSLIHCIKKGEADYPTSH